ncbi:transposase [Dyadobacter sediminis]|uniref:Transposase n=1 Tax=Dyadobacter sediminis TaxID=1493691 RepID=A0A5R9K8L0_9BACT|nr:transposase [Dyadobacter sediminis]TLU90333.1 transposase [Dyadobacter sediminis]GGC06964.1 hypothetical protein GCM10011325_37240 [Dyadobacter sediminis]
MELGEIYLYTATITKQRNLLQSEKYKCVVLDSLYYLVHCRKMAVYGFVIMPDHIHLIWELLETNGKEYPHASFMKYTSHLFQKDLRKNDPELLEQYRVDFRTRKYHFWQMNSLATQVFSSTIFLSKLTYIHNIPVQEKWQLAAAPEQYRFSSASFYMTGKDEFKFLTHISERI